MKYCRLFLLLLCLTVASLFLAGCFEETAFPEIVTDTTARKAKPSIPDPKPFANAVPVYQVIGKSVRGRPIRASFIGEGPETVLVMATIHGNEPAGTPLVNELSTFLQDNPHYVAGRTVIIIPVANPDGLAANSRYNSRGVDLNRNFQAPNRTNNYRSGIAGLSEPESRALRDFIVLHRPARIVSIHQPLACIDYDGPAYGLANTMAKYCHLPVNKLGARPGSLGSWAGEQMNIPIVTLELPPGTPSTEVLWDRYGKALLAAVVFPDRVQ